MWHPPRTDRRPSQKCRPQYNETIKSLQFRQLYRHEGENTGMDGEVMSSGGRMQL